MDTDYHTPMEALKLDCHPVPCIPSIVSSLVTHVLQSPGSTQWPGSSIKVKYYILGLTLNGQIGCLFYLDARQNFLAQMKYDEPWPRDPLPPSLYPGQRELSENP